MSMRAYAKYNIKTNEVYCDIGRSGLDEKDLINAAKAYSEALEELDYLAEDIYTILDTTLEDVKHLTINDVLKTFRIIGATTKLNIFSEGYISIFGILMYIRNREYFIEVVQENDMDFTKNLIIL